MIRQMTIFLAFKKKGKTIQKKIIEDNSYNVDSILGLDNDNTSNILGQERNGFWSPPDYILYQHDKISNTPLKDDILKDSLRTFIKESSNDCYMQKSLYGIQAKFFSSIKTLISIFESSKNDEPKIQITSVIHVICSTNLDISRLRRVFAAPFFQHEYKKFFLNSLLYNSPSLAWTLIKRQKKSSKNNQQQICIEFHQFRL